MKILNKIKQNISSFFDNFLTTKITTPEGFKNSFEEKLETDNGTTEVKLHNIHTYNSAGMYNISEEQIDEMLKKLLSSHNIDRLEKKLVLLDICKDCLTLHGALIPLVDLNIAYSIDVIGGSIRDFLLDNHKQIKDLDILINLNPSFKNMDYYLSHMIGHKELNIKKITEKSWCTEDELNAVNFSDNDELYEKHNKLVQLCLNRKHELVSTKVFTKNEREKTSELLYGEDILKELSGIIKIESKELKYPIELLLTDRGVERFYSTIDFGICNVGLKIVNLDTNNHLELIDVHKISENFAISNDFLQDIKNKTITYNTYNRSFEQIEYSFNNHLKRVQAKFPEHKVEFSKNEIDDETKKYIDSIRLMGDLSESLVKEDKSVIKRKANKL